MKKFTFILTILIFGQTTFAQNSALSEKVSEDYIGQIFKYYSDFDLKLLDFVSNNISFNDFTMGLKYNSKEKIRKVLTGSPESIQNYKAEVKSIFYVSPNVVDVQGIISGVMNGKAFRTPFSTVLIFDDDKKIVSWTDHVDPKTFEGNSSATGKNKKFIKDFFKFYENLNPDGIEKFVDQNVRLIDPTLKLDYGIQKIKDAWKESSETFSGGKFEIKKIYFIAEDVIDVNGVIKATARNGKKLLTPFSTVFILENGKIKHWVDHINKEAFRNL